MNLYHVHCATRHKERVILVLTTSAEEAKKIAYSTPMGKDETFVIHAVRQADRVADGVWMMETVVCY
jgi:hypothetical protein